MRPADFTPEQIIQAGRDLQAAGRNITGFALRQRVGGGNPTRLKQIWEEHISSTAAEAAEPVAELPVEVAEEVATVTKELTDRLAALAVELNDKAVKAAERRVAEVVRTAGEQREQAERELTDAAQTVEELETRLDEAGAKIGELENDLAGAGETNKAQAVELAQLRERLAAAEQQARTAAEQHAAALAELRAKLEKAEAHGYGLTDRVNELQGALYEANAATASENAFRRRAEDDLQAANSKAAELQGKLAEAEASHQAQAVELAQVRERLAATEQQAGACAEQRTAALSEASELRQSVKELTGELGKANGECEALRRQAADQAKTIASFAAGKVGKGAKGGGDAQG